ncbi:hypothetical protein B4U79_03547 [Dinothrombium tinctorium]|uniref:Uncharacterized protein n=1 Tax=Dinothrombium tinctorium TaxID=1965070 RepID=A0A3S3P841_9ACAR|nr:hypothetical protein B4U79_07040 [Dinothrombium tinctorium]RWS16993.1 hypothetical protein B4U79_03547 [Dinothrombium tinctorium]
MQVFVDQFTARSSIIANTSIVHTAIQRYS